MTTYKFWDELTVNVDYAQLEKEAVSVKGFLYKNPTRFFEIYSEPYNNISYFKNKTGFDLPGDQEILKNFIPKIPGSATQFGFDVSQPPFSWKDCTAETMLTNFTYNTSAFYRIIETLAEQGLIPKDKVAQILDLACILLSHIYKSNNFNLIRNINNNINMFLISKVVEKLLGRNIYNSEYQEPFSTSNSLKIALEMSEEHLSLSLKQKMGLALGKGIAFIESHVENGELKKAESQKIQENVFRYVEKKLAIDDRDKLINSIQYANQINKKITMSVILDDTTESIDDLLWLQQLMIEFPVLMIFLIVNTAQVSVNFSADMMISVLEYPTFKPLNSLLKKQFFIKEIYCPLISFQPEFMNPETIKLINDSDLVFVKGMNFFETCQFKDKNTFYSFVVYGPVSSLYTGYMDLDGIFAFVPSGLTGFQHHKDYSQIQTLRMIC